MIQTFTEQNITKYTSSKRIKCMTVEQRKVVREKLQTLNVYLCGNIKWCRTLLKSSK